MRGPAGAAASLVDARPGWGCRLLVDARPGRGHRLAQPGEPCGSRSSDARGASPARTARPRATWWRPRASGCSSTSAAGRSVPCSATPTSTRSTRSASVTCTPTTAWTCATTRWRAPSTRTARSRGSRSTVRPRRRCGSAARMNHPVETFGFRLEHAGRSLAYSADTGQTGALVELARDAEVLLCEASFAPADDAAAAALPEGLHLTARQAGQHAARAGVGQLVLTHLVPWND